MVILLQSVKLNFVSFFDIFHLAILNKAILLQSVTGCYSKVRQILQSVTEFMTECLRYYKV